MRRDLWIDAGAGVAGDMLLGALLDAGARLAAVEGAVESVVPDAVEVSRERVRRAGLGATRVVVRPGARADEPRPWVELRQVLAAADLDEPVRRRALATFGALARAEAAAHGTPEEEVHFHEVGAWDSVADVVGVAAALHDLEIGAVTSTHVGLGSGTVQTAHGTMPVPVPAVLTLLAGSSLGSGGDASLAGECATPTGVALLVVATDGAPPLAAPTGRILATGVGAGTRDTPGRANVVRVVVHEPSPEVVPGGTAQGGPDRLVELAANVDDLDPRVWPDVIEGLLDLGALDAWLVPVHMKKGRPALVVHALAPLDRREAVCDHLLDHTSTLGVRWHEVDRTALDRVWREVRLDGGVVRVKLGVRSGVVATATPELEDARAVAAATGRPLRRVLREAEAAAQLAGWGQGAPGEAI